MSSTVLVLVLVTSSLLLGSSALELNQTYQQLQVTNTKWTNENLSSAAPILKFSLQAISLNLGADIPSSINAITTSHQLSEDPKRGQWNIKLRSSKLPNATLKQVRPLKNMNILEYQFSWPIVHKEERGLVCFQYKDPSQEWIKWYPLYSGNEWPLKNVNRTLPRNLVSFSEDVNELAYITSGGIAIVFDELHPWTTPFLVPNLPEDHFCLTFTLHPYIPQYEHLEVYSRLKFRIIMAGNIRLLQKALIRLGYINRPSRLPDTAMFGSSLFWSSDTLQPINSGNLGAKEMDRFITQLKEHQLDTAHTVLELSWNWQENAGDLFPQDAIGFKNLTNIAANSNLTLALPLSLHYERFSTWSMKYNSPDGYYHLYEQLQVNDFAHHLDILQSNYNLTGYKIESTSPRIEMDNIDKSKLAEDVTYKYPYFLTTLFTQTLNHFSTQNTYETAFKAQRIASFLRVKVKNSGVHLAEVFGQMLAASMAGYQWLGVEIYGGTPDEAEHDEMMVEWIKATALLPAMIVSTEAPWSFPGPLRAEMNFRLLNVTKGVVKLRQVFSGTMLKLAKAWIANKAVSPILRPMWYAAPEEAQSYAITDQYMLGNDIIVAPFVKGKSNRKVYLPSGNWVNTCDDGGSSNGPTWIENVKPKREGEEMLPIFVRENVKHPFDGLNCDLRIN